MQRSAPRFVLFSIGVLILATVGWVLSGRAANQAKPRVSISTDWSHQRLIFSRPSSEAELARVQQDPRYSQQIYRRQQQVMIKEEDRDWADRFRRHFFPVRHDWAQDLGTGTTSPGTAPGLYAAKFSFDINEASCGTDPTPDFVVFSTGLTGSLTQASIVAYDNLYKGCPSGTVPTVYWAYNTGGQVLTSPIISEDGTQIAFVETTAGVGNLVLLKWSGSSGGSFDLPALISTVLPPLYQTCSAPCMTQISLEDSGGNPTDDQTSSVFYDYANDVAWIGGAGGWLHKVTGVFKGTPAEVMSGAFPVQMYSGDTSPLSSPVYDSGSQTVFVGDYGGFLYGVDAATGAVTQSGQLDYGTGIVESPVVDSAAGLVYVFSSSDGSGDCVSGLNCAAVFQLPVSFSSGAPGNETTVGESSATGITPNPLYIGGFDSAYFSSITRTGNLYVCGNTGGNATIYQISITAGVMPITGQGTPLAQLPSTGSTAACSPVTDVPNPNGSPGPIERIFVSTQDDGSAAVCAGGGCLSSFVDTPWNASTEYAAGQQILSSRLHTETVIQGGGGLSGTTTPSWGIRAGLTTSDYHVTWIDQGTVAPALSAWAPSTSYTANSGRILDSNGNVEVALIGGKSGVSAPSWSTIIGNSTNDNKVTWVNAGPFASASIAATGGASGIIWDNIVSPTTLNGASQIYFSTLGNQACTGGTGGCAVQASQAGLN